jgi:cAMP and cAMP-inhibited cGMP 3',5'-cyclic phosphodiesterase 10
MYLLYKFIHVQDSLTSVNCPFQVGFILGICIPCYDLLHKLIPETEPLLEACKVNLARWRELVEEQIVPEEETETE